MSPDRNFSNHRRIVRWLAVPFPNAKSMLLAATAALCPNLNSYKKSSLDSFEDIILYRQSSTYDGNTGEASGLHVNDSFSPRLRAS
jgi:hypothetical protein